MSTNQGSGREVEGPRQPINLRIGPVLKANLDREAKLSGISVSELIRRKLGDGEPYVPEPDFSGDTMNRIKFDLSRAEQDLSSLYQVEGLTVAKVASVGHPDDLYRLGIAVNLSIFSLPGEEKDSVEKSPTLAGYEHKVIEALWSRLRGEVKDRVRALKACQLMLELIEDMKAHHHATEEQLARFLKRVPYEYPELGFG